MTTSKRPARRLTWVRTGDRPPVWTSLDERYRVWEQARPREDGVHYGAARVGQKKWLTDCATLREAKELCEEHARKEDGCAQ